jgi:uncharacterized membrane protein YdjX (TVP38/TMEM64 family)
MADVDSEQPPPDEPKADNFLNDAFGLAVVDWRKYTLASWPGSLVQAMAVDEPPGAATYVLWGLGVVAVVAGSWLLTRRAKGELDEIMDEES